MTKVFRLFLVIVAVAVLMSGCGGAGSASGNSGGGGVSNNPAPTVTALSPAAAVVGAPAQTLTINGTNFLSSSTVTFNGVTRPATFVSSTQLTIALTAGDEATLGSMPVVVTNPPPGGGASNSVVFAVNNPAPAISSISPTSATAGAVAQTLTINGANFLSTSTVTFNGAAHSATLVSPTRLTISLSAADQMTVGSFPVIVTNPLGGGPSGRFNFNVISTAAIASSTTGNALAVMIQGTNVTAYIPNGSWDGSTTGVQVVPIEPIPVGLANSVATPDAVNSCASNSLTGQTVCTANGTDVYVITGSTLNTTLTSASNAIRPPGPTGCKNCGVGIDAVSNTAIISMGLAAAPTGTGIQLLNLANNTFASPVLAVNSISEGIQADPCRGIVLSPSESGTFDLFNTASATVTEFVDKISGAPPLEAAAEDCTTGIAVASIEDTNQALIADLSQATFTPGSPTGAWSAPTQIMTFPEFSGFSNGTDGISIIQGSHLAIITGESDGNQFGVLSLPSTSGSGTPAIVDYVAAVLPNTPDGHLFEQGTEPHTVGAYTSPNTGKAFGVMSNGFFVPSTYAAVIDLQALLNAPRIAGTHTVDPSYDLLLNGVVRYVATH